MPRDSNRQFKSDETRFNRLRRRDVLRATSVTGVGAWISSSKVVAAAEQVGDTKVDRDDTYSNPVYEPIFADPSIIRVPDGAYYAYGTQDASPDWNCDDAAMPILRSENLVDWEHVGDVFEEWPDWKDDGFLWAPDIARYDDQYYVYYSYSEWGDENPGIGVATADHPTGPFDDHGKLFLSDEIGVGNSIDPQLFVEAETPYLIWGSWHGIHGVELTADGLDWKAGTTFQLAGDAYEAPYIVKRDGYYYLFVSTGSCCDGHTSSYEIEVGRSDSFFGTYYNQNGVDLNEIDEWNAGEAIVTENDRFAGPGHNATVLDDNGVEWILYHAYDKTESEFECSGAPRRSMMLDELSWDDGFPGIADDAPATYQSTPTTYETFANTDANFDLTGDFSLEYYAIEAAGDARKRIDEYGTIYGSDLVAERSTITTTVIGQERANGRANAGLLLRNDATEPGESTGYVRLRATPNHGIVLEYDENEDGFCDSRTRAGETSYPMHLKLEKNGTTIAGSYSTDGTEWRRVDEIDLESVETTQDAGIFVSVDLGRETDEIPSRVSTEIEAVSDRGSSAVAAKPTSRARFYRFTVENR